MPNDSRVEDSSYSSVPGVHEMEEVKPVETASILDTRRREQVKKRLEETKANHTPEFLLKTNKCVRCGFYNPSACVCDELKPIPCKHKLSVMLHPAEFGRMTSTHQIMAMTLQNAEVCIWNTDEFPSGLSVWEHVVADCGRTGRKPVVLFPSPDALTVPQLVSTMTDEERKAGVHVIVLEGTWSNAKSMSRDLPESVQKVVIQPPRVDTLFSTLRTQPAPGKVSTLEAVACLFDELRAAYRLPLHELESYSPSSVSAVLLASASCAAASDMVGAGHEGEDLWATRLRYNLMIWVDAASRVSCKLGPRTQTAGYQTWRVKGAGSFSRVPARIVAKIIAYAYGDDVAPVSGYTPKRAVGCKDWGAVLGAPLTHAKRTAPKGPAVLHEPEQDAFQCAGLAASLELSTKGGDAADPSPAVGSHRRKRRFLPKGANALGPLALCSYGLLVLSAGRFHGSWKSSGDDAEDSDET